MTDGVLFRACNDDDVGGASGMRRAFVRVWRRGEDDDRDAGAV